MESKQEAIEDFVALYEEKTGNIWKNRDKFEKQPGKLYPLDIDYGEVLITFLRFKIFLHYKNGLKFILCRANRSQKCQV